MSRRKLTPVEEAKQKLIEALIDDKLACWGSNPRDWLPDIARDGFTGFAKMSKRALVRAAHDSGVAERKEIKPCLALLTGRQRNLRVRLERRNGRGVTVRFPVSEVEHHHGVKWADLDDTDRMSLAEDYALWTYARKHGNHEEFAHVQFDLDSDPLADA